MADRIEPALSAGEWARAAEWEITVTERFGGVGSIEPAQAIALANNALPDDDPRKVTRERISELRGAVTVAERDGVYESEYRPIREFLDALASYLPPEGKAPAD